MRPAIDHIEITVADLDRAERFYDALLPLLGFDLKHKGRGEFPAWEHTEIDYGTADFSLGLVCPRPALAGEGVCRRKPGSLHHLAFRAESAQQVDALYLAVLSIPGVTVVAPPQLYPEYTPDYYAFFFKDTEGIKLEIVHFDRPACYPDTKKPPEGA